MKPKILLISLIFVFSCGAAWAAVSTEELAARARKGQGIFNDELLRRDKEVERIMAHPSKLPLEKELAVRKVQEEFLKKSREIHLKYREPFIQRVIAETNATLPEGKKIKAGLGSGIYLRDKATGRIKLDKKGRKILNPQHRGMQGDLDLGGDGRAAKRLEETFNKYRNIYLPDVGSAGPDTRKVMTGNVMDGPGHRDFGDVEVTINITGESDVPGSSSHQTRVKMDAFSKETYVSFGMKDQAGKNLVETNDNIKKAVKGFVSPPEKLLGSAGEKALQGMSKGTLKSIESGNVSDAQLSRVLNESGYKGDLAEFKGRLNMLKEGQLDRGVGLGRENIESFQQACRKTADQAFNNASQQFDTEKKVLQTRIDEYDARIKSGEISGDQLEEYKKASRKLREELIDSKIKVEETTLANRVKLEGGSYGDYYEKTALTGARPVKAAPEMTRMQAIKNGLKPGMLDVAGYGVSAFNIYDNVTRMQKGEISQNDAVIGITKEVVDTGFGVVSDVGTAAAVGSIGTGTLGAVATVGVPLVVAAGTGYALSAAVEEGLRAFEALKTEEISEKIAKSKKEEVINKLQLLTDEMLKAGEATGDWRYFAKADDIADSLERMYVVTGDDDFRNNFNSVYDRVTQKKDQLESKYKCSIYALHGKMKELKADGGVTTGTQQPAEGRPVVLPPFKIAGYLDNSGGSPISGPVQNGDILEFRAEVEHPASPAPLPTQVFWQVYDSGKRPLEGLSKPVNTYETGGRKPYAFRFRIDNFDNGDYMVAMTHRLVSNPGIMTQAVFVFRVFQAVRIDSLLVTDGKDGQTNRTLLYPGQAPQIFVYYSLAKNSGKVRVELAARENNSGRVLESATVERPRDGEAPPYRVGLGLPAEMLKAGDDITFEARITSRDGKTQTARTAFSIVPEKYDLKVNAPKMIAGDQVARYSLTPPDGFEPPFVVQASGGEGLVIKSDSDPLQGRFQGSATTVVRNHVLSFIVRDAKGRTASGSTTVTVSGLDTGTLSNRGQPAPSSYVGPRQTPAPVSPVQAPERAGSGGQADDDYKQKLKNTMDVYTKEKMRIQQQQTGTPAGKPATLPKQTTPAWLSGQSGSGKQQGSTQTGKKKTWRYGPSQKVDCFRRNMNCQKNCPQVGQAGANCRQRCDQGVYVPCVKAICPNGYTGQGDYIRCKIYE